MMFSLFISCPKGLEYLLEDEVRSLGLDVSRVSPNGVYGEGNLTVIYQLCLWSRIANRVQLILFTGAANNQQALYQLCREFAWNDVFQADKTLAIEFHGVSEAIRNSMFGAQVIKDAVVDYFRDQTNERPTIDRESPQIRLHAHLKHNQVTVSLDLTGYSLHQRGYRMDVGAAPLKENVAAALLVRAKWPLLANQGFGLHDPFCGSGTLVIEAAMMAADFAPGLLRDDQSFLYWTQHDAALWQQIRYEARQRVKPLTIKLTGSDIDARAIRAASANAKRTGVAAWIDWSTQAFTEQPTSKPAQGLLICNPPYGERLNEVMELIPLYGQLGQVLHEHYQGWNAAVLTSNPLLAKAIGLRATKQYTVYNGALECKLYCMELTAENRLRSGELTHARSAGGEMFANRLKKNYTHLRKWAKRNQISCYRIYDADLPEYAFAIDLYNDYVVMQEYVAPASVPVHVAEKRSLEVMQILPGLLDIPAQHLIVKQRKQQKGSQQYERIATDRRVLMVNEGQAQFEVNLYDYLDTGLFLDHRLLRMRFAQLKPGTRFLNCFCYTSTASVHAALAGAVTTSVDLSNTYLNWAKRNFQLNRIDPSKHQFVQYDCLEWLNIAKDRFDVIFLDPPSFSNSKRMNTTLDIQRDHESLIHAAMKLLSAQGTLYFSTNLRQFKLSPLIMEQYSVRDISAETIDIDFKRNQRIHQCFMLNP